MKNFRTPLRFYSWCSTRGAHGNLAQSCSAHVVRPGFVARGVPFATLFPPISPKTLPGPSQLPSGHKPHTPPIPVEKAPYNPANKTSHPEVKSLPGLLSFESPFLQTAAPYSFPETGMHSQTHSPSFCHKTASESLSHNSPAEARFPRSQLQQAALQ